MSVPVTKVQWKSDTARTESHQRKCQRAHTSKPNSYATPPDLRAPASPPTWLCTPDTDSVALRGLALGLERSNFRIRGCPAPVSHFNARLCPARLSCYRKRSSLLPLAWAWASSASEAGVLVVQVTSCQSCLHLACFCGRAF